MLRRYFLILKKHYSRNQKSSDLTNKNKVN